MQREETVTDRVARGVGLEIVPGVHRFTHKKGFFAIHCALLGNFPICWKPTEAEARAKGETFVKEFERKK